VKRKPKPATDHALGMDRDITRRDFLNGASIAIGGTIVGAPWRDAGAATAVAQSQPGYYPPTREGMRGSHPGSFELAHEMRDGRRWDDPASSTDTGELFDLVVVGGGISGLAAAYYYRKAMGPDARILIIDNHDDFGGHAKRNEYHYKDRMFIDLGGTAYIENPAGYPKNAKALIKELGIDVNQARDVFDHDLYPSLDLRGGVFFQEETFGKDKLVAGKAGLVNSDLQSAYITLPAELENGVGNEEDVRLFISQAPLSDKAREEIVELFAGDTDYLAGKTQDQKIKTLKSMSYVDFLTDVVDATPETVEFFRMWRASYMGNGVDLPPALEAMRYGLPGSKGLGIADHLRSFGYQPTNYKDDFHFPDGNASVARMLVRKLVPAVAPGDSMHDIISARFDYSKLDQPDWPVKIRLNSTAVHVRHRDERSVEVTYVEGGNASRIRAKNCVMACYHAIVPHICPELPEEQKHALANTIRMPLVSISVLLDNWTSFANLGIKSAYCPGSFACDLRLTYPLKFDDYQSATSPDEPITLRMYRIPLPGGGLPAREQFRLGRHELLAMPFETFERQVRDQLGRLLKDGGFDPARDIKAITVNRWPHGYAVGYDNASETMSYFSSTPWTDDMRLWLKGRRRHGRIAFANSDAQASAMTESAIEQAYRATSELLNDS
jgi:spermidine dehydrogenase